MVARIVVALRRLGRAGPARSSAPATRSIPTSAARPQHDDVPEPFLADDVAQADVEIQVGGRRPARHGRVVVVAGDRRHVRRAAHGRRPSRGQAREALTAAHPVPTPPASALASPVGRRGRPCPTRTRTGPRRSPRSPACSSIAALVALLVAVARRRRSSPARFTDPLRRLTRGRRGASARATCPAASRRRAGERRDARDRRAVPPVQRDGRPARGERRDHPPRPRPEPRLPGRRLARAADADRRPADVQRAAAGAGRRATRRPAPSSSSRAASSSSASTGWPRTCSSSRSSTPASSCSTCGRTTCGPRSSRPSSRPTPAARRTGRRRSALRLPDRPVRIRHDPQRIGQVVTNLVGNALKFTPRGGSVVRSTLEPTRDGARIEVARHRRRDRRRELPRIFDRFYRGSLANEARGSGSGLGLAIVKSIVDMHGGRIAVDSRLGVGTTFTVILPRDPRARRGHRRRPPTVAPTRRGAGRGPTPAM